ncbi:MAG TPA: hypothetical protein VJ596_06930 [Gemmatimonadaceae bacterium]|nr:hypothetical protein [Gemmatimonadaceae bacterium]
MSTQLSLQRQDLPPPRFDLLDAGRAVGWVRGNIVGFGGFATEAEAAHAAWVAYRTIMRRLARRTGQRPIPIDVEPLTLVHDGDRQSILASGRLIGTLVRPAANSSTTLDSYGFEVEVPPPADELLVRAIAYAAYRTLRKGSVRWRMWERPAPQPRKQVRAQPSSSPMKLPLTVVMTAIVLALLAVMVAALPRPTMPIVVALVTGIAASAVLSLTQRPRTRPTT